MRPAEAPVQHKPGEYKNQDERDEALESRYDFDHEGLPSVLAYVDANTDALVEQFFAWRRRQTFAEPLADELVSFERMRFGLELYPAAHGLLRFAVRCKLDPKDGGRVMPAAKQPSAIPNAHNRNVLAQAKAMPATELSEEQYERRQAELLEQRSRIVGEEG